VSLSTPETIRRLQRTLYVTAKQAPARRFHGLFDKVWRNDILAHAYALSRANGGAPGVDEETFADIEAAGRDRWLGELREEVRTGRYTPQPVRRVLIPKASGVGQRPLGIPTIRDRVVQTAAVLVLERSSKRTSTRRPTGIDRSGARSPRFARSPAPLTRDTPRLWTPICRSTSTRFRTPR